MAVPKIYVDPGHGGTDGGATSHGVKESAIVVAVSNYLAAELKRQGFDYMCSRTDDGTTKSLEARVNAANAYKAHSFVSLHCNWSDSEAPNGTQTYIYAFGGEAEKLAKRIQNRLQPVNGVSKWERVEDDNFYVLRKTTMPAVLIELGFVTNATDRKYLTNATNQKYLAKEICKGICEYYGKVYKEEPGMDNKPDGYAKDDIAWAVENGILKGNEKGDYMLHSNLTRQDFLVFLHRYDEMKK